MPCATNKPPCGRDGCGPCLDRSLFARKDDLEARRIECLLSDVAMKKTSRGTNDDVTWMCGTCGHAWEAQPKAVVGLCSGCPYCNENNPTDPCGDEDCLDCAARSLFAWKDALEARGITCGLTDEQMRRMPGSSGFYVAWTCARSKHSWDASPVDVCAKGRCCGYCGGGPKPPCGSDSCDICMARSLYACKAELADRMIESLLDDDEMRCTARCQNLPKLPWRCLECENEWKAKANAVISAKTGCPICNKPGATEKTVRDAVRAMDLGDFETVVDADEWAPEGGVDGNMRYSFDVRVKVIADDEPPRSFVVEVDGVQHFGPWALDYVGEDHANRLRRDVEKMAWAIERGVPVVRVPTSKVAWCTERDRDWKAKLAELCRAAAEWTGGDEMPLFLYPRTERLYARHVEMLEEAIDACRSKRARVE